MAETKTTAKKGRPPKATTTAKAENTNTEIA